MNGFSSNFKSCLLDIAIALIYLLFHWESNKNIFQLASCKIESTKLFSTKVCWLLNWESCPLCRKFETFSSCFVLMVLQYNPGSIWDILNWHPFRYKFSSVCCMHTMHLDTWQQQHTNLSSVETVNPKTQQCDFACGRLLYWTGLTNTGGRMDTQTGRDEGTHQQCIGIGSFYRQSR